LTPDDPELLKNMGLALVRMHRWNDSIPVILEAIEKHPDDYPDAVSLLADALFNCGRSDEAWICYQELYKSDESNLYALFQMIAAGLRRVYWDGLQDQISLLKEKSKSFTDPVAAPLVGLAFPGLDSADHRRIAEGHARTAIYTGAPSFQFSVPDAESRNAKHKLRIAYVSGDFRRHPVGFVIAEIIERHDRNAVEVFGYATTADDGSAIRQRLEGSFDCFVDVSGLTVHKFVDRLRADDLDILIDLSGWTLHSRPESIALRCAPVQVNWLGYPGTMGHAALADYIIGDPVITPAEDAAFYTEHIAQLPFCYLPFDTTRTIGERPTRRAAGLPESGFVFCSFNGVYKYNPPLFDLWCSILRDAEDSVLWMSDHGEQTSAALRQEAEARGIDPQRLVFAPRVESQEDHLARVQLADLALDPFPYNSHSTGLDTLWAGVPLLALNGKTFASRVGASMLTASGLEELIADTPEQYRDIALALVKNPERLNELRARLQAARHSSALFDMGGFARNLERLYRAMWQNHCAGKHAAILSAAMPDQGSARLVGE
jgi:predicted O-linked N-acetylglucosamine transferase (SPINDLY family)